MIVKRGYIQKSGVVVSIATVIAILMNNTPRVDLLDKDALFEADKAFMTAQHNGYTPALCVRAAIEAYLDALSNPKSIKLY